MTYLLNAVMRTARGEILPTCSQSDLYSVYLYVPSQSLDRRDRFEAC